MWLPKKSSLINPTKLSHQIKSIDQKSHIAYNRCSSPSQLSSKISLPSKNVDPNSKSKITTSKIYQSTHSSPKSQIPNKLATYQSLPLLSKSTQHPKPNPTPIIYHIITITIYHKSYDGTLSRCLSLEKTKATIKEHHHSCDLYTSARMLEKKLHKVGCYWHVKTKTSRSTTSNVYTHDT